MHPGGSWYLWRFRTNVVQKCMCLRTTYQHLTMRRVRDGASGGSAEDEGCSGPIYDRAGCSMYSSAVSV